MSNRLPPAQARAYELVRANPGMTIQQLAAIAGVSHATATYHLAALVKKGILIRERDGRELKHYVKTASTTDQFLASLWRDAKKRMVIECIVARRWTASVNELAGLLGLTFGYLKRTLAQLQGHGFVTVVTVNSRYSIGVNSTLIAGVNRLRASEPSVESVSSRLLLSAT